MRIVVKLCRIDWSTFSWVISVHPYSITSQTPSRFFILFFNERASHSNGPTETAHYCQGGWKTVIAEILPRSLCWREYSVGDNVIWLETMEMVQNECPVWWLNRGGHCHSWNWDCCGCDMHINQLRDGVNVSPECDVEAPTGGLSSQASTEESSIEDKDTPETPTTTTDSRPAENVDEPNWTEASRYVCRVHRLPQRYSEQNY